jgi:hypothetical protein
MKKNIFILIAVMTLLCVGKLSAQNDFKDGESRIALSIALPDQADPLPDGARTYLVNKLKQAAAQNGLAAEEGYTRFFITAVITPMSKDIVAGPPQQIAQNLEITLYIADGFDQKLYATTTVNAKGVGTNETKSYIDAVKHINTNSKQFKEFAETGKAKIIAYYEAQCDNIIKKAQSLATQKKYEAALYELTAIPDVCKCYDRALEATADVYQQYIDHLCDVNLAQARSAWAAEQNSYGAKKAGEYLAYIYPDAKCYNEAMSLYREIKGKVLDDWKFEMKIYQDDVDLEKERIKAWRDVGVAYGNHQQPISNYVNWLFR